MSQICELRSTQPRTIHCIFMYLIALHHASIRSQMYSSFHRDPLLNLTQVDNKLPVHYHERGGRSSCAPCVLRKLHCLWQSNFFKAIGRLRVAAIHVFQMPVVLSNMKASKPLLQRQSSMCFGQMYGRPWSDQENVRSVHYQRERNRKVAPPLKPLLRINTHWDICIANPFSIYIP